MSNWYDVSVVAESMQQQVVAALADYGPVKEHEHARALVDQAKHALGMLADLASAQGSTPVPVVPEPPAKVTPCKASYANIASVIAVLAHIADVEPNVFRSNSKHGKMIAARSAIAWMLYNGVSFVVPPSWPELAEAVGIANHSVLIQAARRAPSHAPMVRAMFDELERLGILTQERPDWARKEQAA